MAPVLTAGRLPMTMADAHMVGQLPGHRVHSVALPRVTRCLHTAEEVTAAPAQRLPMVVAHMADHRMEIQCRLMPDAHRAMAAASVAAQPEASAVVAAPMDSVVDMFRQVAVATHPLEVAGIPRLAGAATLHSEAAVVVVTAVAEAEATAAAVGTIAKL